MDESLRHLAIAHPLTRRIGDYLTPTTLLATGCRTKWGTGGNTARPVRTLNPEFVTCEDCKASPAFAAALNDTITDDQDPDARPEETTTEATPEE